MLSSSELSKLVAEITGQDENHLYSEISQLSGSSKIRVALQRLRNRIRDLESRRVVLITDVSGDEVLIETDIPQEAIEDWCRTNNKDLKNRENIFLDLLKENYYVKLLYDSDVEKFGYDEAYDLFNY